MTPKLLVSVRSAAEADEALAGGADLIDVKEPNLGSLGRASDAIVAQIVQRVGGRVLTSAALGELHDWDGTVPAGVDFVKAGLAGLAAADWRKRLDRFRLAAGGRAVIVAYADWEAAGAPPLEDVVTYAENIVDSVLLIDTCRKTGSTLLDLISEPTLVNCIARIRRVIGRIALAGSLSSSTAIQAASLRPDWIAVRGAVCDRGRTGRVSRESVKQIRRRIEAASRAA
jgi:(5-formylfuran-3-yl)methyl phosphate synthase